MTALNMDRLIHKHHNDPDLQAVFKRVRELESEVERLREVGKRLAQDKFDIQVHRINVDARVRELEAENKRYRSALEWYAKETNWNYDQIRPDDYDGSGGKRAREALGGEGVSR